MLTVYLFLAALIISIGVSFALKVNAGAIALFFAFFNGIFFYGFSASQVIRMWPISLFLMLFLIMFFYGFSISNGTVENLASQIAYASRKMPYLLPIALWLFCIAIAGAGAGPYAVFAFLSVIVMRIAVKAGINRLLAAIIVLTGGTIGGQVPISVGGLVVQNYASAVGYESVALAVSSHVFRNILIAEGLIFIIIYFVCGGHKLKNPDIEKPEPMTEKQKRTFAIMIFVVLLSVVPPFLAVIFPSASFIVTLAGACDITFTCTVGILLNMLFRVGDEKAAFGVVPWPTILLICGIGVLIATATSIGVIDSLSVWIQNNVQGKNSIYLLMLAGAIMSFFSSTLGVVVPTLSTLVPVFASITGASPGFLFSALTVPAYMTGFSPFSSAGAITMAGAPESERPQLFNFLLAAPVVNTIFACLLVLIGIVR